MTPFPKLSLKPKAVSVTPVVKVAVITRKATPVNPTKPANSPKPAKRIPKPPKVKQIPPTPEELAANRIKAKARTVAVLNEIMARWPLLFPETGADLQYPLAIGIRHAIAKIFIDEGIVRNKTPLTHAIALYMDAHYKAYQTLLAQGGPRYNLELQPDGEVTEEQMAAAVKRLNPTS